MRNSHGNGKVQFKNSSVSPSRYPSPGPGSLNNTINFSLPNNMTSNSLSNLADSNRQILAIRKNNYRQSQLKKIDSENLKIFQNLLRIKSSLSKQNMTKHVRDNNNLRNMLAQYDQKPDPLVSIDQKHKYQQRRGTTERSPLGLKPANNTATLLGLAKSEVNSGNQSSRRSGTQSSVHSRFVSRGG